MAARRNTAMAALAAVLLAACDGGSPESTGDDAIDTTAPAESVANAATTPPTDPPTTATDPPTTAAPTTTAATTTTTTVAPTTTAPTAPPTTTIPTVEAAAYSVYDMRSGEFLAASEADARLPVASLIKLLTTHTAYVAGQPTKTVVAPEGLIIDAEESRIGITPGQELPRDLLIRALLIVSANDAARALAIDIAGGEPQFAELMNQQAAALGLTNTRAVNATGLDAEGQFSSANDLTRLAAMLMANPTFQLTVRRPDATLNGQTLPATNDLLGSYSGADGVKTGRTTEAEWCIVASAQRDGRRIIVTVLGAPTEEARDAAATGLLDWAFTQP